MSRHESRNAIALAAKAHAGQVDKAGAPYILHPLRMMLRVSTPEERMAAVLHDVVEDCGVSLADLREAGFSEAVVAAVDALTRREEESYEEFVARAAKDPVGRRVKLADLEDNSDLSRIAEPTQRDFERLEKYRRAIAFLEAAGAGSWRRAPACRSSFHAQLFLRCSPPPCCRPCPRWRIPRCRRATRSPATGFP